MIEFQPGDIIAKKYQVLSVIGKGGMGIVYKVFDDIASLHVALKTLNS